MNESLDPDAPANAVITMQASPYDCPDAKAAWKIGPLPQRWSRWLQYLYFLRFPLLAWLLLPALCLLDAYGGASAATRGIMTLGRMWQASFTVFFVTALMVTVLICTRNIVLNGYARFSSIPPLPLYCFIQSQSTREMLLALLMAQVPALLTLLYIATTTWHEQLRPGSAHYYIVGFGQYGWQLWVSYAAGLLFAFFFWYLVSLIYFWIYPAFKTREPAALIFPPNWRSFQKARWEKRPRLAAWLESASKVFLRMTHEGYAASGQGQLWELHSFSAIALLSFFVLYLMLYLLLAPVIIGSGLRECIIGALLVVLALVGSSDVPEKEPITPARSGSVANSLQEQSWVKASWSFCRSCFVVGMTGRFFTGYCCLLLLLFASLVVFDDHLGRTLLKTAFPTIASLLVLVIFGLWLLSGASFLFDRYRMPVLSVVLLLIFGMKFLPIDQEHYFAAIPTTRLEGQDQLAPATIIADRLRQSDEPLIIVTASGGGIQAADWTAQVMAQLEKRFREDSSMHTNGYTFHDHLLLLSGVSGGSVGLLPYLLEYTAAPGTGFPAVPRNLPDGRAPRIVDGRAVDALTDRLTLGPSCSSLEAVAWGLEYYDLQQLLLTFRIPWLQRTTDGAAPDRTWALTRALNRNLDDVDCGTDGLMTRKNEERVSIPAGYTDSGLPLIQSGEELTLKEGASRLQARTIPAFTFNTTVAETGGRFLLSNYVFQERTPKPIHYPIQAGEDFVPAETFLHAFTQASRCEQGSLKQDCYADISLATAAQLSATFPFVSSATRIPKTVAARASHFVDGGYFDNDGTSSVVEFLRAALPGDACPQQVAVATKANMAASDPTTAASGAGSAPPASCESSARAKQLRVLLIEIRDGDDLNPEENKDDWAHQTGSTLEAGQAGPTAWTTNTQLLAPLLGMWNAGHVSVTRRNRRELCLLEQAWGPDRLDLHHVVIGIPSQRVAGRADQSKVAPLSWKLTAGQQAYIESWAAKGEPTQNAISAAIRWVDSKLPGAPSAQSSKADDWETTQVCQALDESYMRR